MGGAASLGLRMGSGGYLPAAGAVPAGRKARGWGLRGTGVGDKERLQLLHRTLRLVGRRGSGLLLLLAVASAAPICSLFAIVKDRIFNYSPSAASTQSLESERAVTKKEGIQFAREYGCLSGMQSEDESECGVVV